MKSMHLLLPVLISIVACGGTTPSARGTPQVASQHAAVCGLAIEGVKPLRVDIHYGKATLSELRGAKLVVPANSGVTKESIQLAFERCQTIWEDPVAVFGSRITVDSL